MANRPMQIISTKIAPVAMLVLLLGLIPQSNALAFVLRPLTSGSVYVSTLGNDNAKGTREDPFRSISRAISSISANQLSTDLILLGEEYQLADVDNYGGGEVAQVRANGYTRITMRPDLDRIRYVWSETQINGYPSFYLDNYSFTIQNIDWQIPLDVDVQGESKNTKFELKGNSFSNRAHVSVEGWDSSQALISENTFEAVNPYVSTLLTLDQHQEARIEVADNTFNFLPSSERDAYSAFKPWRVTGIRSYRDGTIIHNNTFVMLNQSRFTHSAGELSGWFLGINIKTGNDIHINTNNFQDFLGTPVLVDATPGWLSQGTFIRNG